MASDGTVAHAAAVGERIGTNLAALAMLEGVKEVRRIGTMTGIEVTPRGERTGFRICQEARRRGVWVRPLGDVVVLMPPLAIDFAQVDELTGVVTEAIEEVLG